MALALWGAALSTLLAVLQVLLAVRDRPRLQLTVHANARVGVPPLIGIDRRMG